MAKIIFILNSIQQQRCLKRIEEFIDNGYQIEAYGFNRGGEIPTKPSSFVINTIGNVSNTMPFGKRFVLMRDAIKTVINKYKNQDVVFYYFLLDVAIAGRSISSHKYIYENSDLMYGYFRGIKQKLFEFLDKWIIRHSLITVFTSGGFLEYLYKGVNPGNIVVIPNRLNKKNLNLPYQPSFMDINHLRFSFVGFIRQEAVKTVARVIAKHFPNHEFHVFGLIGLDKIGVYQELESKYSNIHLHGSFSNPFDLPAIYEKTDIIVSAIGDSSNGNLNVLYAEPNKLYESIYFRKPIIVSGGTYLSDKVDNLGIGYSLKEKTEEEIISLISGLTEESLNAKIKNLVAIDKNTAVDNNPHLFLLLEEKLRK